MSQNALTSLESAQRLFFRTRRHPAADELALRGLVFETFDEIYESAKCFDDVYCTIADRILSEARNGDVTYAVPGHPFVAERSVPLLVKLAKSEGIQLKFAASTSFIEACLEALGAPVDKGLKLIDALEMDCISPSSDCPNLIYQVFDTMVASRVKLALMETYPDEFTVYAISGAGGPDAKVEAMPLYELDRKEYDHLSSVFVPELNESD